MFKGNTLTHKIGIQFFAEGDNGGAGGNGSNGGNQGGQGGQGGQNGSQGGQGKTFTQDEVNAVAAKEKKTARQALFKALGVEVIDDDFEKATKAVKEVLDAGKSQQQKDQEAAKAATAAKTETDKKNALLQAQVDVMKAGVKPDYVDDAISMLMPKVTEDKPLSKLLEEYKEKYPLWYGESGGSRGTGGFNNPARNKGGNNQESYGQRLAKQDKSPAKSSYFHN